MRANTRPRRVLDRPSEEIHTRWAISSIGFRNLHSRTSRHRREGCIQRRTCHGQRSLFAADPGAADWNPEGAQLKAALAHFGWTWFRRDFRAARHGPTGLSPQTGTPTGSPGQDVSGSELSLGAARQPVIQSEAPGGERRWRLQGSWRPRALNHALAVMRGGSDPFTVSSRKVARRRCSPAGRMLFRACARGRA